MDDEVTVVSPKTRGKIPTNRELFEKRNKKKREFSLDYDKIYGNETKMALPQLMKGKVKEKRELPDISYRLPSSFKFTSDERYTDVDLVRDKLRMNLMDHKHFEPMLGAEEGQKYYGKIYQPNKDTYVSVKDPKAKNKLLKITKPTGF